MRHPWVVLGGAATLFVQLALIRYIPGQIRVLGYFTNFVLLASFLGFGLGILARRRWRDRFPLGSWAPLALFAVVGGAELGRVLHVLPSPEDFLFLEYAQRGLEVPLHFFLAGSFLLLTLAFIPLGHAVGRTLEGDRPLLRYGLNIAGSLGGIALFSGLSALGTSPAVWMALAGCLSLIGVAIEGKRRIFPALLLVGSTIVLVFLATRNSVWSPYHKLTVGPVRLSAERVIQEWNLPRLTEEQRSRLQVLPSERGFTLRVNDDSYQTPLDLRDESVDRWPGLRRLRNQYDLPFELEVGRGNVLVLGAGTGNDVAGALRAGAEHVDAVEIDPAILAFGSQHPENPYGDPRVRTYVGDARSFLARTRTQYDLIVLGLLDSHILLNARSPVRLDSFVFTKESFRLASRRLKPGGILFVSHAVGTSWFSDRMQRTLEEAFGKTPQIVLSKAKKHAIGTAYAAGENLPPGTPVNEEAISLEDDWPFLYLEGQKIPQDYLIAMLIMGLLSLLGIRWVSGQGFGDIQWRYFFLGAGFLLLETRGVTVLSVHLGSTWSVSAAVFGGVLTMALLGTWVGHRLTVAGGPRPFVLLLTYGILALFLSVAYFFPAGRLSDLPIALRIGVGALLVSLPLLASGVIYAMALTRDKEADRALASNLIGAMAGGLVEYVSMITGFRALVLLGAVFYLLAFWFDRAALRPLGHRSGS